MVVLWMVASLTLVAAAVASWSVSQHRYYQRQAEAGTMERVLDSAIRQAMLAAVNGTVDRWLIGQSRQLLVLDVAVDVTIEREAGRIDMSAAPQSLLHALFAGNGMAPNDAEELAVRIVEARQSGRLADVKLNELPAAVFDALTVYTHLQNPEWTWAPPAALLALQWARQNSVAAEWMTDVIAEHRSDDGVRTEFGDLLRVRACTVNQQWSRCRVAVLRPLSNTVHPWQTFAWRSETPI